MDFRNMKSCSLVGGGGGATAVTLFRKFIHIQENKLYNIPGSVN
jgi:hypothetical protein